MRANGLDGKTWTRYSISVWSDIRKEAEEKRLGHPASFPVQLAVRLLECFTTDEDKVILDPFAGVGSTLVAAERVGKVGIGVELSPTFAKMAQSRLERSVVHCADANNLLKLVGPESVDIVITSPPYWDVLTRRRTADGKETRHYGDAPEDLGKITDYHDFLRALQKVFAQVFQALKGGKYCLVVVMDVRKGSRFYPLHADAASMMQETGFIYDDLIVWDRRHEYNNLRPLGYPFVFRINRAHEFILIFRKPKEGS